MRPAQFADRVAEMEISLQEKCHEIKSSRAIISQLLSQAACDTRDNHTNTSLSTSNKETQIFSSSRSMGT